MIFKRFLLMVFSVLLIVGCIDESPPEKVMRDIVIDDVKGFLNAAEDVHPNLYLYSSKENIISELKIDVETLCEELCDKWQVRVVLSRMIRNIGTDHVFITGEGSELGVKLYKDGDRIYFYDRDSGSTGDLDSVNGKNPSRVWSDLRSLSRRLNENSDESYVSSFSSKSLPWVVGDKTIELVSKGKVYRYELGSSKAVRQLNFKSYRSFLYFKIPNMSKVDINFIRGSIEKVGGRNIVLDLRGNPGGSVAKTSRLFELLTGIHGFNSISPFKNRVIKLSKVHTELKRSRFMWFFFSASLECGFKDAYYYFSEPKLSPVCENVEAGSRVPRAKNVENIMVIIDGQTASSAAVLAGQLKAHGAKIYGEIAFGNSDRNFGNPQSIRLQNIDVKISVPTTYTYRDSVGEDGPWPNSSYKGVAPEVACRFDRCLDLIESSFD